MPTAERVQQIGGADAHHTGDQEADGGTDRGDEAERSTELETTNEEITSKTKYEKYFAIHKRNNPEPRAGDSGK
jgi:hypothetical protein